jgi:hypothetical protein
MKKLQIESCQSSARRVRLASVSIRSARAGIAKEIIISEGAENAPSSILTSLPVSAKPFYYQPKNKRV